MRRKQANAFELSMLIPSHTIGFVDPILRRMILGRCQMYVLLIWIERIASFHTARLFSFILHINHNDFGYVCAILSCYALALLYVNNTYMGDCDGSLWLFVYLLHWVCRYPVNQSFDAATIKQYTVNSMNITSDDVPTFDVTRHWLP